MNQCLVVIPALNPQTELITYVEALTTQGFSNILIIDDGSEPDHQVVFDELKKLLSVDLLVHETNRGKGAGLKSAFKYYLEHKDHHQWQGVITVDSDGQHLVSDVERINDEINGANSWLVLGTRKFDTEDVPKKSLFGNRTTTGFFRLFYGKTISDTQTGLRGISDELIPHMLDIEGDRFEYEMNMLIWAVKHGVFISEVPIQTVYLNDNESSNFRAIADSYLIYKHILKSFLVFILVAISSFLIDVTLFQLLILVFERMTSGARIGLAALIARLSSSLYNYAMNKKFTFKNDDQVKKSIFKYYALMVVELVISTVIVFLIYRITFLPELLIKVLVDSAIFVISFFIQKYFVFNSHR